MEDMLCAMALKSANGRQIQHTQTGLLVCCERALKSVGERTTHGTTRGRVPVRGPSGNRPRERRVRSGQRNPLWTKITPGIAGLAAGSHARRPALNEIREFRKAIPRPRRGSDNWFSAARGLQKALEDATTHTPTTGNPHAICMYMYDLWLGHFARSSLRRDVAFSPRFLHNAVRVSTTGHQGSQYLLHGKRIYQCSELCIAAWH
jgi:hypothetical protein